MSGAETRRRAALKRLALGAVVALVFSSSTVIAAADHRPFGDARVLAKIPAPGFPEGIAVRRKTFYVAGPATFGTTVLNRDGSRVWAFDIDTGSLLAEHEADDKPATPSEHANSSVAFDGKGRLYVLNTSRGIYRFDPDGEGGPESYSEPFPDLPPCRAVLHTSSECSPTRSDAPPIPNDITFDAGGTAYVTDSTQATIWRVPQDPNTEIGTRRPTIWLQDERLASDYIGVNGIRLNPERTHFFITVSTDLEGRSRVYTVPAGSPARENLHVFHEYADGELPDGLAFGRSGLLYVAIANPTTPGVSILRHDDAAQMGTPKGSEWRRLRNPVGSVAHPYDSPANIAFNKKGSILVTNHAFATGGANPDQFSVLDVFVGDKASPLEEPRLP